MVLGGNLSYLTKNPHATKLLNILRENGASSKVEIAEIMGLTFPTVTNILNVLMDIGFVKEGGKGVSQGGRRPILYELNSESVYVIGIDITVHDINLGLLNLQTELVKSCTIQSPTDKTPKAYVENVYKGVQALVESENIPRDQMIGIGVSAPGPIHSKKGKVYHPPNLPLWDVVPLRKLLEKKLMIPVKIEKDANVAALGEMWFGAGQKVNHLVYVLISEGIGGGVILNRSLFQNNNFGIGEIGHGTIDVTGPLCNCGNYGCLEVMASGMAILKEYEKRIHLKEGSTNKTTYSTLLRALENREELACNTVDELSEFLGVGITNV